MLTAPERREYWQKRGATYIEEERLQKEWFHKQEGFVLETVAALKPQSILELGCGYGRISKVLLEAMPGLSLTGLDLSPDQVSNARIYCKQYERNLYTGRGAFFLDFDILEAASFLTADLCLAIELFLHLDHADLMRIIPLALESCPVLVHDFDVDPRDFKSRHIAAHDYKQLYTDLGCDFEEMVMSVADDDPIGLMVVRAA